jgi:hypothetical protein
MKCERTLYAVAGYQLLVAGDFFQREGYPGMQMASFGRGPVQIEGPSGIFPVGPEANRKFRPKAAARRIAWDSSLGLW